MPNVIKENGTGERISDAVHQNKGSHSMKIFTVLFIDSFVNSFFKGENNNVYEKCWY
jgi:hypothetical protein